MLVIEKAGYGQVPASANQNATVSLGQLINDLIRYGVTRYKFELAMKIAKPACKRDPKNCGYYIRQAFKSLGIDIPVSMANQLGQQQTQQTQIYQRLPQNNESSSLSTSMLILGGAVVGGVLLAYYLSNRS